MNSVIVYDSAYGNTAKVAHAIGAAVRDYGQSIVLLVDEADNSKLAGIDLLIIGSPTQAGRATQAIQDFITALPKFSGVKFAAFDTRLAENDQGMVLRLFMKTLGYAAEKMSVAIEAKSGEMVQAPEGFIVIGKEGPLKDGELERATGWSRGLLAAEL